MTYQQGIQKYSILFWRMKKLPIQLLVHDLAHHIAQQSIKLQTCCDRYLLSQTYPQPLSSRAKDINSQQINTIDRRKRTTDYKDSLLNVGNKNYQQMIDNKGKYFKNQSQLSRSNSSGRDAYKMALNHRVNSKQWKGQMNDSSRDKSEFQTLRSLYKKLQKGA